MLGYIIELNIIRMLTIINIFESFISKTNKTYSKNLIFLNKSRLFALFASFCGA